MAKNAYLNESNLRKFTVGDYDYYTEVSQKNFSWNWAAFFLGGFWLAYRKMYLYTALYVLIFAFVYLSLPSGYLTGITLTLVMAIILGASGNNIYLSHAKRKIARVLNKHNDPKTQDYTLSKLGGTSVFPPIILMLSPFILAIVIQNLFPDSGIFPIQL